MTQYNIKSIISIRMNDGDKEYYCDLSRKKPIWLKEHQIMNFEKHIRSFNLSKKKILQDNKAEVDNIQQCNNYFKIISQIADFPCSGLQCETKYHGHDFYFYSGEVFTYNEIKQDHPEELLQFWEKKIISTNNLK